MQTMSISVRSIQPFWNTQLAQLYQMACLGQLTSGLLHDLANPVQLVALNLEQLKEGTVGISTTSEVISRATLGIKRIELFLDAGRKYVQQQSVNVRFAPAEEINQALLIFTAKAQAAEVKITVAADDDIWLQGDPIKFYQVISNLISNAIDAYQEVPKSSRNQKHQIHISLRESANAITLTVQDWGRGVAKEHLSHIFEPFFTTKRSGQGLGIGLAITKEIIEKEFKGKIKVKSQEGRGTEFRVRIPLSHSKKKG